MLLKRDFVTAMNVNISIDICWLIWVNRTQFVRYSPVERLIISAGIASSIASSIATSFALRGALAVATQTAKMRLTFSIIDVFLLVENE